MSDVVTPPVADERRTAMRVLLVVGLLLRVAICCASGPFNRDDHLAVIRFVAEHHALPRSDALQQAFHPPLYYLLAWPFYSAARTWPLHGLSLAFSCANLLWVRRLFDHPIVRAVAPSASTRALAFGLVATLPSLARWSSFVSNDPLAFLVGTAVFAATLRLLRAPTTRAAALLGGAVALGLLTKGTFLLAGVALAPVVGAATRRPRAVAIFCAAWLVLGSYKYVDNAVRMGRPVVHNLEFLTPPPGAPSLTIWRGPRTAYDLDPTELVRHPVMRPKYPASYAQTLYGSFWYAYMGDDAFRGNVSGYDLVGRATYAAAVVPTGLALLGGGLALARLRRAIAGDAASLALAAALALFLANLAVVVAAGVRFDRWECFQGRLLLPSAMPLATLLLAGLARLDAAWPRLRAAAGVACWAVVALGVLYFVVELALLARVLPVDDALLYESLHDWRAPA